jgi:energy-coupling factor transporter transmembrane protein EcfT
VDLSRFINSIVSFVQNNTVIAIIIALGLLFFMYRKPKLFFILLILALFLVGLFYLIMNLAGSGSGQKKKMIQEEEEKVDLGHDHFQVTSLYSQPTSFRFSSFLSHSLILIVIESIPSILVGNDC